MHAARVPSHHGVCRYLCELSAQKIVKRKSRWEAYRIPWRESDALPEKLSWSPLVQSRFLDHLSKYGVNSNCTSGSCEVIFTFHNK